jgi:hypothetical protein
MDGWADYLHSSLTGEHALFPALRLTSFGTFITASILSASICLAERCAWFSRSFCVPKAQQNSEMHMTLVLQLLDFCTFAALDTLSSCPPVKSA